MGEFGRARGAERAAGQGIAGLGQQGYDMLRGQIGMLGGLGATGRGIQDANNLYRFQAAQTMADEPWTRMGRGLSMLQGIAPYGATYSRGVNPQMAAMQGYTDPGGMSRFGRNLQGASELWSLFKNFGQGGG